MHRLVRTSTAVVLPLVRVPVRFLRTLQSRHPIIHKMATPPDAPSDPSRRVATSLGITFTDHGPSAGPIVVALHGCPGSTFDWRWMGPGLEPHVRFLRLELPGHGQTPASAAQGDASPEAAASAAWEAVDAILGPLSSDAPQPRVALLGHSLGTEVAVAMAQQRPGRVSAVALLAPVGIKAHRAARPVSVVVGLARICAVPSLQPLTRPFIRALYTRILGFPNRVSTDEFFWCQQRIASRNFVRYAASVHALWREQAIPTLLAWSLDDPLIEPAIFEGLSDALGHESGPRLVFAKGGHNINKSQARAISHALVTWLRTLAVAPSLLLVGEDASGPGDSEAHSASSPSTVAPRL